MAKLEDGRILRTIDHALLLTLESEDATKTSELHTRKFRGPSLVLLQVANRQSLHITTHR